LVKIVNIWYACFVRFRGGFERDGWFGLVNFSFVSGFIIGLLLGLILAGYFCLHLLEMRSRRH
jgi:hypothetical protein